jgi:phenylacetate-CoA ligase
VSWVSIDEIESLCAEPVSERREEPEVRWSAGYVVATVLAGIDGVARWQLEISREGTLDRVAVIVTLDRPKLVDDPMWAGRIREAVESVVPVRIETRAIGADDGPPGLAGPVLDHRGHHTAVDREAAARALALAAS